MAGATGKARVTAITEGGLQVWSNREGLHVRDSKLRKGSEISSHVHTTMYAKLGLICRVKS